MDDKSAHPMDGRHRYPRGRLGGRPEKPDAPRRLYHPPLVSRPYPPLFGTPPLAESLLERLSEPPPPDLVFIVGPEGTIHYCNRAAADRSDSDVLGNSLLDYIVSDDRETVRLALEPVFRGDGPRGFDTKGMSPFVDGAVYECRVAPNERDGRVVSATVIARDVTESRAAEQRLKTARDRLRSQLDASTQEVKHLKEQLVEHGARRLERDRLHAIIDAAGEALIVIDPETGKFVDVNDTACRWLGHPRDKLLTLTTADVDVEFSLDVSDRPEELLAEARAAPRPVIETGEVIRRSDGSSFAVEVSLLERRVAGREYVLVIARDVATRGNRAAEGQSDDATSGVNRGRTVLVIDRDREVLSAVTEVLDRAGIQTVTTETPLAGAEVMRPHSGEIGAVLLGSGSDLDDINEVVSRIHHADPGVPIVLMSDQILDDELEDGTLSGVVGLVRKPIYPLALIEQVRRALR